MNPQTADEAAAAFHGVKPTAANKSVKQLGEPIPGYSGVNRRIQADNVLNGTLLLGMSLTPAELRLSFWKWK